MTDGPELTDLPDEVALTLRRYGIRVPDADQPYVVRAYILVRGLADQLAALPDVAVFGPAERLGFPPAECAPAADSGLGD